MWSDPRPPLPFVPAAVARPLDVTLPTAAMLVSEVPGATAGAALALTALGATLRRFARTEPSLVRDASEVERGRVEILQAVRVYTCVLRRAGVPLPATLIAVARAVRSDTAVALSADAWHAIQHDAARCCLEAYFGP